MTVDEILTILQVFILSYSQRPYEVASLSSIRER